jgi:hypothetical protein
MNRRRLGLLVATMFFAAPLATPLAAQAFAYPAMQPARITAREYNFALGDAGGNLTSIIFQWREGLGNPKGMFVLDAGVADGGTETALFLGAGGGYQLATSSADMPFDVLLTGTFGLTFADGGTILHIPIGASLGRRFPIDGGFAISPFVHPRIAYTRASGGGSNSDLDVDIGANFEFKPKMAIRLALSMGESDAVGLGFVWTPQGLR